MRSLQPSVQPEENVKNRGGRGAPRERFGGVGLVGWQAGVGPKGPEKIRPQFLNI